MVSLAAVAALTLAACGGGGSPGSSGGGGPISGEITVLTHRTDIVDTVFADYERRFKEIHPDVEIVIVPTLVVFLLLQRWFYNGMTAGAVK